MTDKKPMPTKLLWVDLEMTGLDPMTDLIIEIAAEITDFEFKKIASYEAIVQQPREQVAMLMANNSWWQDYPANKDAFIQKMEQGTASRQVEQALIALIDEHFGSEPALLAGNSIHSDRKFIAHYWPELDAKLHYRMLDVSAWKVLMQGKFGVEFEKQNVHRAYEDIQASIAELHYYLDWFHHQN